jgi:hypothetical protein
VNVASADNPCMPVFGWIGLGLLTVIMAIVMIGLFVEERAVELPRLYDNDSLR